MSALTSHTLSCGMPVVIEPIAGVRSAAVSWLVPAGVGTDPADRVGLGTLLSELLLRGAGDRSSRAFADEMDRLGVARGVDVTPRFMRLSATMIGERLPEALAVIADMVRRPRLEADAVEPARALALQALAGLKDNPQERAAILLAQRHNHPPLNRPTLGTAEGLTAATRQDLAAHWASRALPGGCILGIAGAVEPARTVEHLERLLGGWAGTPTPLTLGPSPTRGTRFHEHDASNQVQIFAAWDAPAERDPDSVLERLAVAVLSGGSASRLFTEVREKRALCYAVSASYATDREYGRTTAYVGTTPERARESLEVLMREMRRINGPESGGGGVSDEELQRAKIGARTGLVFSGESTQARASALAGDVHRLGRARTLAEAAAQIESVTLEQLNAYLARRPWTEPTVVTLGPAGAV